MQDSSSSSRTSASKATNTQEKVHNVVIDTSKIQPNDSIQLQMVMAIIGNKHREFMLDGGSQVSLVHESLIEELGLANSIRQPE